MRYWSLGVYPDQRTDFPGEVFKRDMRNQGRYFFYPAEPALAWNRNTAFLPPSSANGESLI